MRQRQSEYISDIELMELTEEEMNEIANEPDRQPQNRWTVEQKKQAVKMGIYKEEES